MVAGCKTNMKSLIFVLVFISCFSFLSNPFLDTAGTDSSIFLYVAKLFNDGGVPYRDVFDQKGPLIFLIDAIGLKIGGGSFLGVWLLDCLAYACAIFLSFRLCSKFVEKKYALLMTLPLSAIYHLFACGGNMPEMYIIVFALIAYSISIKPFNRAWSFCDCIVMGICVGAILMLKLNMITVALPIVIGWALRKNKVYNASLLLVGLALTVLPFFIYFKMNDALESFWEVYVQYNSQYAKPYKFLPVLNRGCIIMALIFSYNLWLCFDKKMDSEKRFLMRINLVYFIFAWYAVILSGGTYRYYGPIIPACILPIAFSLYRNRRMAGVIAVVSVFVLLATVVQRNVCHSNATKIASLDTLLPFIEDKKSLTVLGCDCLAYLHLNAKSPTRFPYHGTIAHKSESYKKQMLADIVGGNSLYLIEHDNLLENDGPLGMAWAKQYVAANYVLIAQSGKYNLYRRR